MAPKKICVGIQNFKLACTKICGYLKVVGTCSQNLCNGLTMWLGSSAVRVLAR